MRPDVNHYDPARNDSSIDWGQEEKNELAVAKEEIAQLKRNGAFHVDVCTAHLRHIKELQKELEEQTEQENRHILMSNNVEQTLGKILCYPWYKDDKKNFPDATEEDGVCVGEDTIETLADRAAERIRHLEEEISALRIERHKGWLSSDKLAEELKDRDNRIADLTASRDEWRISAKVNADEATKHRQRSEELQARVEELERLLRLCVPWIDANLVVMETGEFLRPVILKALESQPKKEVPQ